MEGTDKSFEVIISDEAAGMLISHARFAAMVSEDAARYLVEEFKEITKSLEKLPARNPWLDDKLLPGRKYRKLLMAKRYLFLYQVKGRTVYVDAIVDCRQDYSWLV